MLPGTLRWAFGALGVTTTWAAFATILVVIRGRADTTLRVTSAAPPKRPPARTTVRAQALEAHPAPALPVAGPATVGGLALTEQHDDGAEAVIQA